MEVLIIQLNKKYNLLDKKWRTIIETIPITDNMDEFLIQKYLVKNQEKIPTLRDYPLIFGWEFPLDPHKTNVGKIDLVFHDGTGNFLIVETKYINYSSGRTAKTKRTKSRKLVKSQAQANAEEFQRIYQIKDVVYHAITNETIEWKYEDFRDFIRMEKEKISELYDFKNLGIYF